MSVQNRVGAEHRLPNTNKRSGRTPVEHRTHHSRTRTKQIIFLSEHNIEHRTSEHRTPNTEHGQPWAVHGQQLVDQLLVDKQVVDQLLVDQLLVNRREFCTVEPT